MFAGAAFISSQEIVMDDLGKMFDALSGMGTVSDDVNFMNKKSTGDVLSIVKEFVTDMRQGFTVDRWLDVLSPKWKKHGVTPSVEQAVCMAFISGNTNIKFDRIKVQASEDGSIALLTCLEYPVFAKLSGSLTGVRNEYACELGLPAGVMHAVWCFQAMVDNAPAMFKEDGVVVVPPLPPKREVRQEAPLCLLIYAGLLAESRCTAGQDGSLDTGRREELDFVTSMAGIFSYMWA